MRLSIPIVAAVLAAASCGTALACTCGCDKDRLLETTPIFFRGRPVAQQQLSGAQRRYEVDVLSVHKGDVAKRVVVYSAIGSAPCGVGYDLGKEVLIGAERGPNGLHTNLCTHICVQKHRAAVEALKPR